MRVCQYGVVGVCYVLYVGVVCMYMNVCMYVQYVVVCVCNCCLLFVY